MRSIVVATDFSAHSDRAARLGMHLARAHGCRVTLFHVDELVDARNLAGMGMPQGLALLATHHRRIVDSQIEQQRIALKAIAPEVEVQSVVRGSGIETALQDLAARQPLDLLIVGSHGQSGSLRAWFGSTAATLSRVSPCPVLVVRPGQDENPCGNYARIVVGVDYRPGTSAMVRLAADLMAPEGELSCVHVWEESPWIQLAAGSDAAAVPDVLTSAHDTEVARMNDFIACMGPLTGLTGKLRRGHPAAELLAEAEAGADLVVVGAHPRHGLERLIGTVADRVLRHAPVPTLLVPEPT